MKKETIRIEGGDLQIKKKKLRGLLQERIDRVDGTHSSMISQPEGFTVF